MEKTPLDILRECLTRKDGLLPIAVIAHYLQSQREQCADDVLFIGISERDADRLRGKASFCRELQNELTRTPDE